MGLFALVRTLVRGAREAVQDSRARDDLVAVPCLRASTIARDPGCSGLPRRRPLHAVICERGLGPARRRVGDSAKAMRAGGTTGAVASRTSRVAQSGLANQSSRAETARRSSHRGSRRSGAGASRARPRADHPGHITDDADDGAAADPAGRDRSGRVNIMLSEWNRIRMSCARPSPTSSARAAENPIRTSAMPTRDKRVIGGD